MYNNITADIEREIAKLQKQRDCTILYWFELGESDRDAFLPPQYPDNPWYVCGYEDRQYQIEVKNC
jgi:hypothetical protein